jgi:Lon protease-like protein
MTLPGVTLFPGSLLPLNIFEPRYRLMLARALEADRIFAVTHCDELTGEPADIGGAGLIRACVQNEDGTSQLVLQGIGRVRFSRWKTREPYFLGVAEKLNSVPVEIDEAQPLMHEIRSLCSDLAAGESSFPERFTTYLAAIDDPEIFSDVLAATLIANPGVRQGLLEELDPLARLEIVRKSLVALARHG